MYILLFNYSNLGIRNMNLLIYLVFLFIQFSFLLQAQSINKNQTNNIRKAIIHNNNNKINPAGEFTEKDKRINNIENNNQDKTQTLSLRSSIIEDRKSFAEYKKAHRKESDLIEEDEWTEDLYCNVLMTSLCGLKLGDNIESYLNNPSYSFYNVREKNAKIIDVSFISPIKCFDSRFYHVFLDEKNIIQGIQAEWYIDKNGIQYKKFCFLRKYLLNILKIPIEQQKETIEYNTNCCSTYTYTNNENHVIVLKSRHWGTIELFFLSTTLPINIYENSHDISPENSFAKSFSEKLYKIDKTRREDHREASKATASFQSKDGSKYIAQSFPACTSKELLSKLIEMNEVQHDMVAYKNLVTAGVITGECIVLRPGEKVFIVDRTLFTGLIKIRRPGELNEYWTVMEAIE